MAEKFILVSLEEEKAKKLAEVISNKTSRKILDYLSEKESSETEISKTLKIPISTVHYNIRHLLKNNLIEPKGFYWSDKGNKVYVYKIAKKLIMIVPKGTKILKNKLKSILPIVAILAAIAGIIQFFSKNVAEKLTGAKYLAESGVTEFAEGVITSASPPTVNVINVIPNYALWFLFGALCAIIIYLIWNWRSKK